MKSQAEQRPLTRDDARTILSPAMIRGIVLMLTDALAIVCALLLAIVPLLQFGRYGMPGSIGDLMIAGVPARASQLLVFAIALIASFQHLGHYQRRLPAWVEIKHVVVGCGVVLLADGFIQFATKVDISRIWLVCTWTLAMAAILLARQVARRVLRIAGLWQIPVVVVGSPGRLDETTEILHAERDLGYRVVASCPLSQVEEAQHDGWRDLLNRHGGELIVLSGDAAELEAGRGKIARLVLERLPFVSVNRMGGLPVIALDACHLVGRDVLLLSVQEPMFRPLARIAKRAFDYVGSLALLAVSAPFAIFAVILIARDGGPILYAHERVGRDGRRFRCLKFRTMRTDAEAVLNRLLEQDANRRAEWQKQRKLRDDPRVTLVGKWMRAYSLDELPQLLNVLRGEMSLVGPRPVTAEELGGFGEHADFYLHMRPGLTGLWQVSGRNGLSHDQRMRLNTWYVKNWSLWLDLVIALRTVKAVVSRSGAY